MSALFLLAVIWATVLLSTYTARLTRLTPILWFLFFGALLRNTGIITEYNAGFITDLGELGILVIMFAIGFEEDTSQFLRTLKRSWGIAFFGGLAPFLTGYMVADYFWNDTIISLVCGLAMTSTAVSLTMVSLKSEGLENSTVAKLIMSAAVLDAFVSLALVALLIPIITGGAATSPTELGLIVTKAAGFILLVYVLARVILPHKTQGWIEAIPFLSRYGLHHLLRLDDGKHTTLTILLMAVTIGLLAHAFGFHPAIGAFFAGLILKHEYFSQDEAIGSYKNTSRIIDDVAFSWLGPIFFVHLGAQIIFDIEILMSLVPVIFVLTVSLVLFQTLSAAVAARFTASMEWSGAVMIGLGMLGRAELSFVVMDITYVQQQIISEDVFYTLMVTAFFLNLAVPIAIKLWKPIYRNGTVNKSD